VCRLTVIFDSSISDDVMAGIPNRRNPLLVPLARVMSMNRYDQA
jgi:hypothetical protein